MEFYGEGQTERNPRDVVARNLGPLWRVQFADINAGKPHKVLRGTDPGIRLLDSADVPANVDLAGVESSVANRTVFFVPHRANGYRVNFRSIWNAGGDTSLAVYMYCVKVGDDKAVLNRGAPYSSTIADPLSHVAADSRGYQAVDLQLVILDPDDDAHVTIIINGIGSNTGNDHGKLYIEFEGL